ncbi:hypothetical protein Cpir12675_002596 [Ceratocystis pirilliformis]|uniref:Uncharacterized protein n=1 Tax=Ceratocystis pirilliformis TaxID=259994 RepID=A0ABR3Z9L4_9PEZI
MMQSLSSPINAAKRIFKRKSSLHGQHRIIDPEDSFRLSKKDEIDYFLVVSHEPKRWLPTRQGYTQYPSCILSPDGTIYQYSPRIDSKAGYITFSSWGCEHCVSQGVRENTDQDVKTGTMAVLLEIRTVKLDRLSRRAVKSVSGDGKESLLCFGQNTSPNDCVVCSSKKIRKMRDKLRWKTVSIPKHMSGNLDDASDEEDIDHRASWDKQWVEGHSSTPSEPLPWYKI